MPNKTRTVGNHLYLYDESGNQVGVKTGFKSPFDRTSYAKQFNSGKLKLSDRDKTLFKKLWPLSQKILDNYKKLKKKK